MKFIISTQELNYLIKKCLDIVSPKATIPILSNLMIEAVNGQLIITSTDLVVGIRCFTDVKVLEEGATTLPAKKLAQLVRELTAANLEITTNSNDLTEIVADASRFKLHGMGKGEFPALPDLTEATHFTLQHTDLKDALYRTAFATSKEDNRYALTGVYLTIANNQATFTGTDGKRLARAFINIQADPAYVGNFIIPFKAVEEISKNLKDEGTLQVYLMADKIAVRTDDSLIVTKLLSGEYPDVARVIPEATEAAIPLHREELITLLRQISLFTADNNNSVRFTLSDGELRLSANAAEVGEGKVSKPANYRGPKLEIAFNPTFFLDILRHSKSVVVTMGVSDAYSPGAIVDQVVASLVSADATPLFILMPMRLSEE
jgi:DNA polymerase-3 subunit beta